MKIASITTNYYNNNLQNRTPNNYQKSLQLATDTVIFRGKGKKHAVEKESGYSEIKNMNLRRSKTIPELTIASKNGEDISTDREKLILSRISSVLKDVESFIKKHPEAKKYKDDLTQELMLTAIIETDNQLEKGSAVNYTTRYQNTRDIIFQNILNTPVNTPIQNIKHVQDPNNQIPDIAERTYTKEKISDILSKLPQRQEFVLKERFGIDTGVQKSLEEVGQTLNMSRNDIRTIEDRAIRKLRHPKYSKEFKKIL